MDASINRVYLAGMKPITKFVALSLTFALSIPGALAAPAKPAKAAAAKSADGKDQDASVLFGSIDDGRLMLEGNIGWPYYPRLGVHYGLSDRLSIGGTFSLGGASAGWSYFGIGFAVPVRFVAWQNDKMSLALRTDPGVTLGFGFFSTLIGINIPVAANFGYTVPLSGNMNIKVGGGLDTGASILVGGGLANAIVIVPILVGPAAEIRVTKDITIPIEAKVGPVIGTFGVGPFVTTGVGFGYKFLAGVTYTL